MLASDSGACDFSFLQDLPILIRFLENTACKAMLVQDVEPSGNGALSGQDWRPGGSVFLGLLKLLRVFAQKQWPSQGKYS
jgi:hypothetical protein